MKTSIRNSLFIALALGLVGSLAAEEVSPVYYHVGVNVAAPGEGQPQVNVFAPGGGVVHFRFIDFQGHEHLASVSFDDRRSQRLFFSDLAPDLPEDLYFLEIRGPVMAVFLDGDQNAGAGFTPVTEMCHSQWMAMERSATDDDAFRVFSKADATIEVLNEDLDLIAEWNVRGGIPAVFSVPAGPNTSYYLQSDARFVASFHDDPVGTLVCQCR